MWFRLGRIGRPYTVTAASAEYILGDFLSQATRIGLVTVNHPSAVQYYTAVPSRDAAHTVTPPASFLCIHTKISHGIRVYNKPCRSFTNCGPTECCCACFGPIRVLRRRSVNVDMYVPPTSRNHLSISQNPQYLPGAGKRLCILPLHRSLRKPFQQPNNTRGVGGCDEWLLSCFLFVLWAYFLAQVRTHKFRWVYCSCEVFKCDNVTPFTSCRGIMRTPAEDRERML